MRYAIVSDVHANRQAWKAVRNDIAAQETDAILCLGDIVGYGPNPAEVLESVHEQSKGIILGNHDAVVGGLFDVELFSDHARAVIEWTQRQLGSAAAEYFAQTPSEIEGDGFWATHAEVFDPTRFNYIEEPEEARENFAACQFPAIFVGHTHHSGMFVLDERTGDIRWYEAMDFALQPGRRYIVNVGSVGDPRDQDVRASYCIFDSDRHEVVYRKVEFDVVAYQTDLRRSGLDIQPYFLQRWTRTDRVTTESMADWVVHVERPPTAAPRVRTAGHGVDRAGRGVALWTESARDQHKRDMQRALAEKVARRRREIETAREAERARIRRALDLRRDSARRVQPPPVPEA